MLPGATRHTRSSNRSQKFADRAKNRNYIAGVRGKARWAELRVERQDFVSTKDFARHAGTGSLAPYVRTIVCGVSLTTLRELWKVREGVCSVSSTKFRHGHSRFSDSRVGFTNLFSFLGGVRWWYF